MARKNISDLEVCIAYDIYNKNNEKWPYEILQSMTGEPEKVCIAAMERAYDREYIECGVSIRTGWLSDKGKQLIVAANGK